MTCRYVMIQATCQPAAAAGSTGLLCCRPFCQHTSFKFSDGAKDHRAGRPPSRPLGLPCGGLGIKDSGQPSTSLDPLGCISQATVTLQHRHERRCRGELYKGCKGLLVEECVLPVSSTGVRNCACMWSSQAAPAISSNLHGGDGAWSLVSHYSPVARFGANVSVRRSCSDLSHPDCGRDMGSRQHAAACPGRPLTRHVWPVHGDIDHGE